ncbi:MAG: DUF4339 domain-containing protein [Phycisphaerae bacterium]|nr:DUF4339 domain-containing protein [Phycisphaerae bacterium]
MTEWFANINKQQYGPVDEAALRGWVSQGRLGPYDLIWSQGMPQWVQAVTVFPGWFGQNPPPLTNVMPTYGAPGTMYQTMPGGMKPHRGTMILIFGIVGLVTFLCCLTIIFSILAWVLGQSDLRAMREGRMDPSGQGITNGGRICGIVGVVLYLVYIILNIAGVFGTVLNNGRWP